MEDIIGKFVVVRASAAGVHAGSLVSYEGRTVVLQNARRLWRWWCNESISLSAVATSGIDNERSRIAPKVDNIVILDACEIITCSDEARKSIMSAKIAEQQ